MSEIASWAHYVYKNLAGSRKEKKERPEQEIPISNYYLAYTNGAFEVALIFEECHGSI